MHKALTKARARTIHPRDLSLDVPSDTPRYWMGEDPYSSHLMNTLSLLFPPGERFFMDAVRAFRSDVKDPRLLSQVRGFLGQEALHSREHKTFNRWLTKFGVDAEGIELHGHHGGSVAQRGGAARVGRGAAAHAVDLACARGARP
jgi:predicted metal-dependent hydrolase